MLVLINPPAAVKDQILINPEQIACVHPVWERTSVEDPAKSVWMLSLDMSNGQSYSVGFDVEENARAVEAMVMKMAGPVAIPEMKA